ncbi:MAG: hypothetical protein F6K26_44150 [Moorea sp. SIO2I5]|nr:hypothetical protein [Moorena sp. SIO2I5]
MENKNPPDQLQSYSEKRMKIMKRQIKVFTAFLLAVVLAFGSQVASAFADTPDPEYFALMSGQQQEVIL